MHVAARPESVTGCSQLPTPATAHQDMSTVPTFIGPHLSSLTFSPHRSTFPWPGSKEDQSLQTISSAPWTALSELPSGRRTCA
ncbi:uncharacterized protein PgNI_03652 [Pyricularia grisea]|uniref:Uncharacterized protein n=1 Tax=Pyricularia grisea TaxID=148305 RepID=A0A6P8BC42_PYRGI|nr:uncharacterized protein PgNI_03652 [Pyricularia grisea]TLD13400.1 hypothetical protein PgNI_03652 [Pyricularia grisea]